MSTTCSDCKKKKKFWLLDEETILALGSLYEEQLRETADLPSQSFSLRIFHEVLKFVQCMRQMEETYIVMRKFDFMKREVEHFLQHREDAYGYLDDHDLNDLIERCENLDFDLGCLLEYRTLRGGTEKKFYERLLKILSSRNSEEHILRDVYSVSKSIEKIKNEISNIKNAAVLLQTTYKNFRCKLLSLAEEN